MISASGYLLGTVLGWIFDLTGFNWTLLLTVPFSMMLFTDLVNLIVYPIARSTMNKNIKKHNFGMPISAFGDRVGEGRAVRSVQVPDGKSGGSEQDKIDNRFGSQRRKKICIL